MQRPQSNRVGEGSAPLLPVGRDTVNRQTKLTTEFGPDKVKIGFVQEFDAAAPPKVFISYSHDSEQHKERVLALANRLRQDGVDATIDQYEASPPEGWPVWMERQVRESDFVLVVCSDVYLKRAERREEHGKGHGVMWESVLTYQQIYDAGSRNEKFIPVLLQGGERSHIPDPLKSATSYRCTTGEEYEQLYRRLTNQPLVSKPKLGKLKPLPARDSQQSPALEPVGSAISPSVLPKERSVPWNVPHQRNDAFTGREQILTELFSDQVNKRKQALFGLGGVGKTQIAVEYAYRHREEYSAVLWAFAGTEQSLRSGFSAIATLLDLPEKNSTEQTKVIDAVKSWLERNEGWLLVFDNADDPPMLKPFLPQQEKGHVLLTSREHTFQSLGILSPREINVLPAGEARVFLLRRTGKDGDAKTPGADALAKELGYLPLALEQAAAYIAATGAGFEDYLVSFRKQRLKVLEKKDPVLGNEAREQQKRTVATAWALNFADIEKQSPASADLLRLSAFLAPDAIPLELLVKGGAKLTQELASELAQAENDPLVVVELLSPLLRFSLVRRDEEKQTYSIHPLVQEVVRDGLSKKEQKTWVKRAVRALNAAFPDVAEFEEWPACDRFLPHALACAGFINTFSIESAQEGLLLSRAGYYLKERAEYAQAEPLYARALTIDEKALGPDHSETLVDLNNLAELYREQGRYQEAEPLYQRSLAMREKKLGPEHPMTATALNNLALLYRAQGRDQEAELLYRRALTIAEKVLGPEHHQTAGSLNNLAGLYHFQGRYQEAEPLHRRALAIREKALGPEHPKTATSLNNLASLYNDQGKSKEAEPLFRRALTIFEKALGSQHPSTAVIRNNLIQFYRKHSRKAEAAALEKSAQAKSQ